MSHSNTPLNNTNKTNRNKTSKKDTRLNPTANATETIYEQLKQLATSVKNVLSSLMMYIHCPKHVGVCLTTVHNFNKCFKEMVFYVF
jgi:hypothetical protein